MTTLTLDSALTRALTWISTHSLESLPEFVRLEWKDQDPESSSLLSLLSSLRTQSTTLYWKDRDSDLEIAGFGEADVLHSLENDKLKSAGRTVHECLSQMATFSFQEETWVSCPTTAFYLGGIQFSSRFVATPEWDSFGAFRFVLPEVEYRKEGSILTTSLTIHFREGSRALQLSELKKRIAVYLSAPFQTPLKAKVTKGPSLSPNRAEWSDLFRQIKQAMGQGSFQKVVLSRRMTASLDRPLNPYEVLLQFQKASLPGFSFCFEFSPNHAFLGLSPELLFRKQGQSVMSEAVAGTRPRGKTPEEDRHFEQELMQSAKDRVEHHFVSEQIQKTFLQWCETLDKDSAITLLKTPRVQHLYQRFKGTLKPDITDMEILLGLHPTSAVCGLPKEPLRSYISQLEPFERGWYAGAVGVIGLTQTTFSVAIRSALLQEETLHLYSGVGIVEDSNENEEWQEMDHKLALYGELISGS